MKENTELRKPNASSAGLTTGNASPAFFGLSLHVHFPVWQYPMIKCSVNDFNDNELHYNHWQTIQSSLDFHGQGGDAGAPKWCSVVWRMMSHAVD